MTDKATHTPLPCPFCGSRALIGQTLDDAWYAMCEVDHCCKLESYWRTEAEALTAWNTRAVSHHRLVEALREAASALGIVEAQRQGGLNPILKRAKDNADAALKAVDHG